MSDSSSFNSTPAGPSSLRSAQSLPPPLPDALERGDDAAADQARQRLSKRGFLSNVSLPLPHLHRKRTESENSSRRSYIEELETTGPQAFDARDLVELAEDPIAELDENYDKDVYRWAVLYENQRGCVTDVAQHIINH